MTKALESDRAIKVVNTAMHGEAALKALAKHEIDVVVMDVEMPVMDGLEALLRMREDWPDVRVVMVSGQTQEGAETTVRALAMGAAGCVGKPKAANMKESIEQVTQELVPLVKALRRDRKEAAPAPLAVRSVRGTGRPKIVVIGASTGGPNALTEVLTGLPAEFPLPIMIVQHMPPMFTPMLAQHLGRDSGRPCSEGRAGELIERNHMYVAPGDYHMTIGATGNRYVVRVNQHAEEHFCRPSVNPLFRSAASHYGKGVLAVMLTGMGDDGIEATRDIVDQGGYVIAQDEESSVVWGMPGAIVRAELAHQVLPLKKIASAILTHCALETARA